MGIEVNDLEIPILCSSIVRSDLNSVCLHLQTANLESSRVRGDEDDGRGFSSILHPHEMSF